MASSHIVSKRRHDRRRLWQRKMKTLSQGRYTKDERQSRKKGRTGGERMKDDEDDDEDGKDVYDDDADAL